MTISTIKDKGATIELAEQDIDRALLIDAWDNDTVLLTIEYGDDLRGQIVLDLDALDEAIEHFLMRASINRGRTV